MTDFQNVSSQVDFAKLEEETLEYWQENKIFEESVSSRPSDKKWNFLDGPPFITGAPHYGSLLSSIPKDLFGRYWTMKGYRVRRVWGWDGHGLPIENKVENKLRIKRKKDIEEVVGVKKFIEECLSYVNVVSAEWRWYVDHIGRWVDFDNAYKTWDLSYMETVMWVFKQLYDKGYVYKGLRVSLFCPHCATPISNFEVAMDADNYKDVTENATTYKYQVKDQPDTYLLAWSTTPWNKIVTPALAVNPELNYAKVKQGDEYYILAKSTLKMLKNEPDYQIVEEFLGSQLLGLEFVPHYDFYQIDPEKVAFKVVSGDFVTADEGTGIVTIAAYGEEDLKLMLRDNIQIVLHVDDEGMIKPEVPKFGGMYYLDSNEKVNQDLAERGLIYEDQPYVHSVAHCWRCGTRLFYAPKDAWYVNVQDLKDKLFKNNQDINWFPKHFKTGRFAKSIEAAPDWNISRNRYWGSPVPVWECDCGERFVPGSLKELEERVGIKITNLHKPFIDEVEINCQKCGEKTKRVPEVLDSWIEAGSAVFAERHFPFETSLELKDFFPPDFVAEYTGQIRAWFYVLHVIATALYDQPGFKNVLVEGVLLGTDGRKMSKNYENYPDPKALLEKYGGDALRIYLMGAVVMKGEDINFDEQGVKEAYRLLLIFWNSYKFFVDYATLENWKCEDTDPDIKDKLTILDKWVLSKLTRLVLDVGSGYDKYDTNKIVSLIRHFMIEDFSTWYIRRSRDRVGIDNLSEDKNICLSVMYGTLVTLTKITAPLAPFITENIFRNLTGEKSVHLEQFPLGDKSLLDEELVNQMAIVRSIVELGHAQRKEAGFKLRQPLASVKYLAPDKLSEDLEQIIAEELNVKLVEYTKSSKTGLSVELDTKLTQSLRDEGEARELIRQIQQMRKDEGLTLKDSLARIEAPNWPTQFEEMILKQTNAKLIETADALAIFKI